MTGMTESSKGSSVAPALATERELSDQEIVERVVAGEGDLFAALMRRYNRQLFRLVRAIVRPDAEAEDALQDAYLNAYVHLVSFEGRSSFSTWMTRIAVRAAGARRQRARRAAEVTDELRAAASRMDRSDPGDETSWNELQKAVERALDPLPEPQRIVALLRLVEGLSSAEVAQRLDVSEEVVRVRLHRARESLRGAWTDRPGAELPLVRRGAQARRAHHGRGGRAQDARTPRSPRIGASLGLDPAR